MTVIQCSPNCQKLTLAILHLIFLYTFNVALENVRYVTLFVMVQRFACYSIMDYY